MGHTTVSEVVTLEPGECACVTPTKINPYSVQFILGGTLCGVDNGDGGFFEHHYNPFDYIVIDYKGEFRYRTKDRIRVQYARDVEYADSPTAYYGKRKECPRCGAYGQGSKCFYCKSNL